MAGSPHVVIAAQKLAGLSGKVHLVLENARGLSALGWRVEVYAQEIDVAVFEAAGAEPRRISRPPLGREHRWRWFGWRVHKRMKRSGALLVGHGESLLQQDVLHLHNCVHRAHEAIHGRPLEPSAESTAARIQRRILTEQTFRHLVANSKLTRDDVIERYGLPPERITVVYPGHDPRRFRPEPRGEAAESLRRLLEVPEGDTLVGLVTSGDFMKRAVGAFLQAVAGLPQSSKDGLHVLVAGKERNLEPYYKLAHATGIGGRVHFLPSRADVETLYRALDLYVHPAHFEEFGMSVLEAMACGIPVLTGELVGASELLEGAARRHLLESTDPDQLRERLDGLLSDPSARSELVDAGVAASRLATWDKNVRQHADVYRGVSS